MNTPTTVALVLVIVGGLNWLLIGLLQFDLVAALFGGQTGPIARIVYVVVGLAAIWVMIRLPALVERRMAVSHAPEPPLRMPPKV